MAYTDKKASELRDMCKARGLPKSGTKAELIDRLEREQREQREQRERLEQERIIKQEIIIKQEAKEMQIEVPVIHHHHQQDVPASPHVSGAGPPFETLSHIKHEYEPPSQSMNIEDINAKVSSLKQEIPNIEMSNEYSHSINSVEQINQLPTVSSSVATSPIVANVAIVEVSSSNNISFEQNNLDQSKLSDSLEKTYSIQKEDTRSEIECELARLLSERKYSLNKPRLFSRDIMMNQSQANGVPYDYDFLLNFVQKSEIYKDGEIPYWFRHDYDRTKYFCESECVRNIGIPVEGLFL